VEGIPITIHQQATRATPATMKNLNIEFSPLTFSFRPAFYTITAMGTTSRVDIRICNFATYEDTPSTAPSHFCQELSPTMASFSSSTCQPNVNSPHILLMGPRRSGKSSIQRVVFYKMSPHETLFLESTNTLGS
jgi:hypothetical protein